jgi:tRNA (uracil-5-)-methyltransferase TRM9
MLNVNKTGNNLCCNYDTIHTMNSDTIQILLDLNRRFYTEFGSSFSATRQRIQPGVRRVLKDLPDSATDAWLDLGCGSGSLAVEWLLAGRQSTYLGLDFSQVLLEDAQRSINNLPGREHVSFAPVDLSGPGWVDGLGAPFTGAFSFAVLHHIPSSALRQKVLNQLNSLLLTEGRFILSVWQFQHSPKLLSRRVPWNQVGLQDSDLEPGDTLLDWRAEGSDSPEKIGLRYVHQFGTVELTNLARESGFQIIESFESDGQGGRLGLYQVWRKMQ